MIMDEDWIPVSSKNQAFKTEIIAGDAEMSKIQIAAEKVMQNGKEGHHNLPMGYPTDCDP